MWIIYKTTCNVNGKIYIGQHKTENANDGYIGSGKLLTRAIEKYGRNNFERKILNIAYTSEEAKKKEEFFITFFESTNLKIGYNITQFAFGGQPITEDARRKISEKLKGIKRSEEFKEKLRKPKGPQSEEHRQKNSVTKKGKKWYCDLVSGQASTFNEHSAPKGWIRGRGPKYKKRDRTHTEEEKQRRSEWAINRYKNEEERKKQSERFKGHVVTKETKEKLRATSLENLERKKREKFGIDSTSTRGSAHSRR